jgi:hypothetical protein
MVENMVLREEIETIRLFLRGMTDKERVDIFREIEEGYCTNCGSSESPCYCWNDE